VTALQWGSLQKQGLTENEGTSTDLTFCFSFGSVSNAYCNYAGNDEFARNLFHFVNFIRLFVEIWILSIDFITIGTVSFLKLDYLQAIK